MKSQFASSTAAALLAGIAFALGLTGCGPVVDIYEVRSPETIGTFPEGGRISLGGYSGLACGPGCQTSSGPTLLWTHTDRGPNGDEIKAGGETRRVFYNPAYQLRATALAFDPSSKSMRPVKTILLSNIDGTPVTGLPNRKGVDERPLNKNKKPLAHDPNGLDLEAIAWDAQGNLWAAEEYRPSIMKFSPRGRLQVRYVPVGTKINSKDRVIEALPAHYATRKSNRGFEGLALAEGKIYAFLQSPLPAEKEGRFLEFDPATEKVTAEYTFDFEKGTNRLGDAVAVRPGVFWVIEQNGKAGTESLHYIAEIDTNRANSRGHARTRRVADLNALGLAFAEKWEGLCLLNPKTAVVIQDNDFGVVEKIPSKAAILKFR